MFLVFLAVVVLACGGRRFSGLRPSRAGGEYFWRGWSKTRGHEPSESTEERFEEWHRMTHGRRQVDDPAPASDDTV